jgi:hypothetical protein
MKTKKDNKLLSVLRSPSETLALRQVIAAGNVYGFGNCIQALQYAWAIKVQKENGFHDAASLIHGRVSDAWESEPKKLNPNEAKALMEFGKAIMAGIMD